MISAEDIYNSYKKLLELNKRNTDKLILQINKTIISVNFDTQLLFNITYLKKQVYIFFLRVMINFLQILTLHTSR